MSSGDSSFAERFAYARWLFHGLQGEEPSQTEIGKRVGRAQATVSDWYPRERPPIDWAVHVPLADYLGVPKDWLVQGGEAPEPQLWSWWITTYRRLHRGEEELPERLGKSHGPLLTKAKRPEPEKVAHPAKKRRGARR